MSVGGGTTLELQSRRGELHRAREHVERYLDQAAQKPFLDARWLNAG
jgi:hypothetical protein